MLRVAGKAVLLVDELRVEKHRRDELLARTDGQLARLGCRSDGVALAVRYVSRVSGAAQPYRSQHRTHVVLPSSADELREDLQSHELSWWTVLRRAQRRLGYALLTTRQTHQLSPPA